MTEIHSGGALEGEITLTPNDGLARANSLVFRAT